MYLISDITGGLEAKRDPMKTCKYKYNDCNVM